jgi:hypothetical protein
LSSARSGAGAREIPTISIRSRLRGSSLTARSDEPRRSQPHNLRQRHRKRPCRAQTSLRQMHVAPPSASLLLLGILPGAQWTCAVARPSGRPVLLCIGEETATAAYGPFPDIEMVVRKVRLSLESGHAQPLHRGPALCQKPTSTHSHLSLCLRLDGLPGSGHRIAARQPTHATMPFRVGLGQRRGFGGLNEG